MREEIKPQQICEVVDFYGMSSFNAKYIGKYRFEEIGSHYPLFEIVEPRSGEYKYCVAELSSRHWINEDGSLELRYSLHAMAYSHSLDEDFYRYNTANYKPKYEVFV